MKLRNVVIGCGLSLILSGCAITPQRVTRISFPTEEYEALPKTGTATVDGQAFLKQVGGTVVTAAGNEVFLNPITSYSLNWYEIVSHGGEPEDPDPQSDSYVRKTVADAEGRFKFEKVAPGEYFVTSHVVWGVPSGHYGYIRWQGGMVTTRLQVEDGKTYHLILNEPIRIQR